MRKNLAIYITSKQGKVECVWEFPLGPFATPMSKDEILKSVKDGVITWASLTDAEEQEGWRNWKMEVREYGDKKEVE